MVICCFDVMLHSLSRHSNCRRRHLMVYCCVGAWRYHLLSLSLSLSLIFVIVASALSLARSLATSLSLSPSPLLSLSLLDYCCIVFYRRHAPSHSHLSHLKIRIVMQKIKKRPRPQTHMRTMIKSRSKYAHGGNNKV
jgi:hypothetical protein